jgi:hypothetical protein
MHESPNTVSSQRKFWINSRVYTSISCAQKWSGLASASCNSRMTAGCGNREHLSRDPLYRQRKNGHANKTSGLGFETGTGRYTNTSSVPSRYAPRHYLKIDHDRFVSHLLDSSLVIILAHLSNSELHNIINGYGLVK